jgi:hypothetical protein
MYRSLKNSPPASRIPYSFKNVNTTTNPVAYAKPIAPTKSLKNDLRCALASTRSVVGVPGLGLPATAASDFPKFRHYAPPQNPHYPCPPGPETLASSFFGNNENKPLIGFVRPKMRLRRANGQRTKLHNSAQQPGFPPQPPSSAPEQLGVGKPAGPRAVADQPPPQHETAPPRPEC